MAPPVRLLVCVGADCSDAKGFDKLMELARSCDSASTVTCQGVCKGPVVGVERDGELRWYSAIRGDRRRTLARLVRTGSGRGALRPAEARSRRGRLKRGDRRRLIDRSSRAGGQ